MKLRDLYARPGLTLSIEFFPPKTEKGDENLFKEIAVLKNLNPSFCSVTYGAGGSTREKTVELVDRIHRECGMEVMCHLTVVGQSKDGVRSVLERLKEKKIENLIALGGDPPQGVADWSVHPDGYHHSAELVREAAGHHWFSIAVAGFPEVHPRAESREADLRYLKEKVDAGADFVLTQLFFDNALYFDYVKQARAAGVKVPIIPGIMPITDFKQLDKFVGMCGATIPAKVRAELTPIQDDLDAVYRYGVDYATRQCQELLDRGAPGLHFYTLNTSRATRDIYLNLKGVPGPSSR